MIKASKSKVGAKAKPVVGNIEFFRKRLEEMRADLLLIVQKKKDEVLPDNEVGDEADVAVQSLTRDLIFEMSGNERHLLEEVEAALRRIEKGTYGLCEGTGKKIPNTRLKAMPYARYCIEYQARFERR